MKIDVITILSFAKFGMDMAIRLGRHFDSKTLNVNNHQIDLDSVDVVEFHKKLVDIGVNEEVLEAMDIAEKELEDEANG